MLYYAYTYRVVNLCTELRNQKVGTEGVLLELFSLLIAESITSFF